MKKASLKSVLLVASSCLLLSGVMVAGTAVAYSYDSLLDVFFTKSEYVQNENETELCESVVKEGIVLLKNEDKALPLKGSETKVALLGQNSVDFVYGGSGSGSVDTSTAPDMKTAFEAAGFTVNQKLWDFYTNGPGKNYRKKTPDEAGHGDFQINEVPQNVYTSDVLSSLDADDVGIVTIGRSGGESADLPLTDMPEGRKYLQLDANEEALLKMACSKFSKVILIVNANNPMELGFLNDEEFKNVKGAIWVGGVGQEGLKAVPKVLNGTVNPSGRLVDTYAYDSTSAPSYANMGNFSFTNSSVTNGTKYLVYGEGIYVGYRYYETRYEDVVLGNTTNFKYSNEVQFPFGYGLSYTTFEWNDFKVKETDDGKSFELSVEVVNAGSEPGKDVVEFYVQKPYTAGGVETASIELVGFAKTRELSHNGKQVVSVKVDKTELTSYDYKSAKTYVLDEGDYYFAVGTNSHTALNNVLALKGKTEANGMDENGDSSLAFKAFNQPSIDKDTYSKSKITNKTISNALDDVSINYYDDSFKYLSRSDWNGTFPVAYKNKAWEASTQLLNDLKFFNIESDTNDDASIAGANIKVGSTDTQYKVQDLMDAEYSDSRWDDIVNQLSFVQQGKLIRLGGYATQQVDRIGLPATQDKDGPSGISGTLVGGTSCMAWPAEVVMASTWNTNMIQNLGVCFGEDSISAGIAGVYGPGADIHRSPYSGRNFEYFSEDACLSSKMADSEMKGLRSKGVIAYVKHFALNDQETNRYGGAIFANEQAVREIFLKGFEGAVVGGEATAMMCAMNRVGARWVGAHKGMMNDILRDEWGYEGMVITDQASVPSMFYQDMISGLWAGTDMWLNTNSSYWSLDDYKSNNTVKYYMHRAAKNIVYSVTKSWAVNEAYKVSEEGIVIEDTSSTFKWRPLLWSVDGVIWAGSAALIALYLIKYLKGKETRHQIH